MKLQGLIQSAHEFSRTDHEKVVKKALFDDKSSAAPPMREADPAFKIELSKDAAAVEENPSDTLAEFGVEE